MNRSTSSETENGYGILSSAADIGIDTREPAFWVPVELSSVPLWGSCRLAYRAGNSSAQSLGLTEATHFTFLHLQAQICEDL